MHIPCVSVATPCGRVVEESEHIPEEAAMGIIFMPFFLLAGLVGAFANTETERVSSLVFVVFAIFFPVFYGGLGFLMGALSAWAYNLVSKWTGGIELELQAPTAAVISP